MRTTVSLYDAKTHLSELGDRAAEGEEILVTKHGKPRFRIVALTDRRPRPGPGMGGLEMSERQRALLERVDWFERDEQLEKDFGMRE